MAPRNLSGVYRRERALRSRLEEPGIREGSVDADSRNGKADLLNKIPLFSECSGAELDAVATVTDKLWLPAGRVLMRQGTAGRELLVLVDGEVTVARAGATIAVRGSGDFIGKLALVTHTAPLRDGAGCDPAATYIRDPHARGMERPPRLRERPADRGAGARSGRE